MFGSNLRSILVLTVVCSPVLAGDYYVDVVNGSDANAGTSPAQAWKTITFASTAAPSGSTNTIHVSPGVYRASTGEVFPLHFQLQRVVGDQGPGATILDGDGGSRILEMISPSGSAAPTSASEVRGLTLRNGTVGILVSAAWNELDPVLADLQISGMSTAGIVGVGHGTAQGGGTVQLTLDHVRITGTLTALDFGTSWGLSSVTASDCSFSGSAADGVRLTTAANLQSFFARCRFETNAGAGVFGDASNAGAMNLRFEDSLFDHNVEGYHVAPSSGTFVNIQAFFERCTVADNSGAGVFAIGPGPNDYAAVLFRGTIVQGNSPNVDASHVLFTRYSSLDGTDPMFVNRAGGDYRLAFGSPCIDVGDPATPDGTLDLAGNARPIDGDLDTHERADIGAYEHAPLFLVSTGQVGTPVQLQLFGPSGGTTTVYFSRLAPVAPQSTPFGDFDLNPASVGTLFTSAVAPGPPIVFHRPIPGNPLLIGRTFSFQALTSSSAAPQGFAYTNAVAVTITP